MLELDQEAKKGIWKGSSRKRSGKGQGVDGAVTEDRIREAVEAWHLADTEAWRFVRAWGARGRLERRRWEDEERRFAGGGEERGEGWGRWFDR